MKLGFRGTLVLILLMAGMAVPTVSIADEHDDPPFADQGFLNVWERTDRPVADLTAARTWIWGPGPRTTGIDEAYVEAAGGWRMVQYFDKSRMEFPIAEDAEPDSPWFITQGLLATELMTGQLQLGHEHFESYPPVEIPVAGDMDDTGGPTYAVVGGLIDRPPRETGNSITETVSSTGETADSPALADYGVTDAHFDDVTHHNIASVFWDFMNSSGIIWDGQAYVEGDVFPNPYYAVGRPRTEAYWAWVKVGGEYQDVLIQCFERRCLTYTPGNPEGWQVESGNIGMHYYEWRYEQLGEPELVDPIVELYVTHVTMPNALDFAEDGRLFFVETFEGTVRVVENGELRSQPFAELEIGFPNGHLENGLLGLALHPQFNENGYVYIYYTYSDEHGNPAGNRVVRFTDQDSVGVDMAIIVDHLPYGTGLHNSGRLAFGPDGMLYVTTGDVGYPDLSQDLSHLAGSVLRYTPGGAIPADNPFGPDDPIYAYGLRNPYGIAFHPDTGDMFITENGPDGYDEVNRVFPGGNYGWPVVQGIAGHPDFIDPIWATTWQRVAPTGITVPVDNVGSAQVAGKVLFCQWNTASLIALELAPEDLSQVVGEETLGVDCQLDVIQGPDGAIYTATGDAIYRYGEPRSWNSESFRATAKNLPLSRV